MFKVGDKVKIKEEARRRMACQQFTAKVLFTIYNFEIGKVIGKVSKHLVKVSFEEINMTVLVDMDDLELVDEKPKHKHKVGDRFLMEYEIVEIDKEDYRLPYKILRKPGDGTFWANDENLDKAIKK